MRIRYPLQRRLLSRALIPGLVPLLLLAGTGCGGGSGGPDQGTQDQVTPTPDGPGGPDATGDVGGGADADGPGVDAAVGATAVLAPPDGASPTAVPFEAMPWPSDARLDDNGFIGLPSLPGGAAGSMAEPNVLAALATKKGFGQTGAVFFPFDGAIDQTSLPSADGSADRGLQPTSSVQLVDLDASPPARVAIRVAYRSKDMLNLVVAAPDPGYTLRPSRHYGAFVTRGAKAMGGLAVAPAAGLAQLLDPQATVNGAVLQKAQASLAPLVAALDGLGVSKDDLVSATVFTTGDQAAELYDLRAWLQNQAVPAATVLTRGDQSGPAVFQGAELDTYLGVPAQEMPGEDNPAASGGGTAYAHDSVQAVIHGTYPAPYLLSATTTEAGVIERDDSGGFTAKAMADIPFTLVLPKCPGTSGCDPTALQVAIFTHGLGGSRHSVVTMSNSLAAAGIATIGIDLPFHGSRYPGAPDNNNDFTGANTPDEIGDESGTNSVLAWFTYMSQDQTTRLNPLAVGDSFRQASLELMQLSRLLKNPAGFSTVATAAAIDFTFDATRLAISGESFGSINSVAPLAAEANFGAAALSVGAVSFFNYLAPYSPTYNGFFTLIRPALGAGPTDIMAGANDAGVRPEFHPAMNVFQTAFEHGDGAIFARLIAAEPREGQTAKHVVMFEAHNDESVPNIATEGQAALIGAQFAMDGEEAMFRWGDLTTVAIGSDGVSANVNGTTLVIQQYEPATHGMITHQHGDRHYAADAMFPPFNPGPAMTIDNPIVKLHEQYVGFIQSYYTSGVPTVVKPQ
jgi:hypothetical protein